MPPTRRTPFKIPRGAPARPLYETQTLSQPHHGIAYRAADAVHPGS